MIAWEVGKLWRSQEDEKDNWPTFSGQITLPYNLPAGTELKAILIPQPLRSKKWEMCKLSIEMPLTEPPPRHWPADLNYKGELMSNFFGPARPAGKRYKILLCGKSGTGKTLSALEFPHGAVIDNHGSTANYQAGFPQNLYFPQAGQIATVENTSLAVSSLLGDPGDRLTLIIDDISTYNKQVDFKWNNLFFVRQEGGKGHHREYYSNQPNDYIHPTREKNAFIRKCLALDMNVILIARMKKLYAGSTGGADFMKIIGDTFDGDVNLIYEFDFAFQLTKEEDGKRYAELMDKQRVPTGSDPFPEKFEFKITKKGHSTFFDVFKKYVVMPAFETPAHAVTDPGEGEPPAEVQGESKVEEKVSAETAKPKQAQVTAGETTKPPSTEKAGCIPIEQGQLDQLVALKGKFNIQKDEWDSLLTKFYGASTARDLSKEQGEHFIDYLSTQRVPF